MGARWSDSYPSVPAEPDEHLWRPLGEHFYRAACAWALLDGEPVERLVLDRFLVAAQDAMPLLDRGAQR